MELRSTPAEAYYYYSSFFVNHMRAPGDPILEKNISVEDANQS